MTVIRKPLTDEDCRFDSVTNCCAGCITGPANTM